MAEKSRWNSTASRLLWFWGVLLFLGSFAIGYPALKTQGNLAPLIALGVWGIATCLAAFALPKRLWGVRWWGSVLCVLSMLVMLVMGVKLSILGIGINAAVLAMILMSWKHHPQ